MRKAIFVLIFLVWLWIPGVVRAEGTYSNPGTGDASDCSNDCITWSQSPVWVIDQYGKFIVTTQNRVNTSTHFAFSNDVGGTWTQSAESYTGLTRGSIAYDSINDVLHVIWSGTDSNDGIIYRRYSINRDGSNNIVSIQRMDAGVNLQLDTSSTRNMEFPIAFWVNDGSTDGTLVAIWGKMGANLTEVRGSMRRLSMTNDDNTAGNWLPLDGSADSFSTDPPAVPADKIYGSTTTGADGVAAKIRGGSGAHKDDLYIFPAVDLSGGFSSVLATRMAWNSTNKDWSNGTTDLGTIGTINDGQGNSLKRQLISKPVIDTTNDRLYLGWARWKDNSAGDTVSFVYLDGVDAISSTVDVYSANGAHSYAPTLDLSFDNTGNKLYVAYVLSQTNGDNGSIEYKTYDGSTLSTATTFYTSPGGTGGKDGSADIPIMMADRLAVNDRIYMGFRVNGDLPPTAIDPHTIRIGYIQLAAVPTPTPIPTATPTPTPSPTPSPSPTPTPTPVPSTNQSTTGTSTPSAPGCNDSAPTQIPDLFQIDAAANSAELYFAPIANINTYAVVYGFIPSEERFGTVFDLGKSQGVLSYMIDNLTPNTAYYFKIRAVNGCAAGQWSNQIKIVTAKKGNTRAVSYFKNFLARIISLVNQARQTVSSTVITGCQYTVVRGDSLWKIATAKWGDGNKYSTLVRLNPLENRSLIHPGQTLNVCE